MVLLFITLRFFKGHRSCGISRQRLKPGRNFYFFRIQKRFSGRWLNLRSVNLSRCELRNDRWDGRENRGGVVGGCRRDMLGHKLHNFRSGIRELSTLVGFRLRRLRDRLPGEKQSRQLLFDASTLQTQGLAWALRWRRDGIEGRRRWVWG